MSTFEQLWKDATGRMASEISIEINKRIIDRLFRKKRWRDPKLYEKCRKHYLSKVIRKRYG